MLLIAIPAGEYCRTHNVSICSYIAYIACGSASLYTGELGYDGPLYGGFLHMTDDMLGSSSMHIKYSSYVYDGFCI